jgi:plasmid maintenance system antidote protein VapI
MKEDIHIGKLIQSKFKDDGHSVVWLAKQMHCDRSNIYRIFKSRHIDVEILIRFCEVLDYDFFTHYSTFVCNNKKIERKV